MPDSFLPQSVRFFPHKHTYFTGVSEYDQNFRILSDPGIDVKAYFPDIFLEKFFALCRRYPFKSFITISSRSVRIVSFVITDHSPNESHINEHRQAMQELFAMFQIPDIECEYIIITQHDPEFDSRD